MRVILLNLLKSKALGGMPRSAALSNNSSSSMGGHGSLPHSIVSKQSFAQTLRGLLTIAAIIIAGTTISAPSANAQPILSKTSCMPQVREAMNARAYLEAERENLQAKNLIYKPDSVLEYSCFEQNLRISGAFTGFEFSEAVLFFGIEDSYLHNMSLDRAIYNVVFVSLSDFLYKNFWHRYLGDRSDLLALPDLDEKEYNCYAMSYVWNKAKCLNYGEDRPLEDGFMTFEELATLDEDIRDLPFPASCPGNVDWAALLQTAESLNEKRQTIPDDYEPNKVVDLQVPLNVIATHTDFTAACAPPVPTGLYLPAMQAFGVKDTDDFACTTPGCYYDGNACVR
jgi:hypothetical protein